MHFWVSCESQKRRLTCKTCPIEIVDRYSCHVTSKKPGACTATYLDIIIKLSGYLTFDSSVGRAWDCNGCQKSRSQGHWFDPGSKDFLSLTA